MKKLFLVVVLALVASTASALYFDIAPASRLFGTPFRR